MTATDRPTRRLFVAQGIVQGVGFRPHVYRLASGLGLCGWTRNTARGVQISLEGRAAEIDSFRIRLLSELPPLARIDNLIEEAPAPEGATSFEIRASDAGGRQEALCPPDATVCSECLAEVSDLSERRYGYPLTNCTDCGPRYSIIRALPYDRPHTTMSDFELCPECAREYHDPLDRRFHAQPVACRECGPWVDLLDRTGARTHQADPVAAAVRLLRDGGVLAVKALGGYHLMVNASDRSAVATLRERKRRGAKPFAVLARSSDDVARVARLSRPERELLESAARPIVLLTRAPGKELPDELAPDVSTLGLMLASTPLQHLLLQGGMPFLVATSGNAPGESMCITETEAVADLSDVCDHFLTYNRAIHARVDDSITRVHMSGSTARVTVLRRARGLVPNTMRPPFELPHVAAVGGELKNAPSVGKGGSIVVGPHIGDLTSRSNQAALDFTLDHLCELFGVRPEVVAHDLHPDFQSTRAAERLGTRRIPVQHHHAHMASCMVDNRLDEPVIGVILDGMGLGEDGTIWGCEVLAGDYEHVERTGYLRPFRLPGGDAAVRQPWRTAVSLLHEAWDEGSSADLAAVVDRPEEAVRVIRRMSERGINSPVTSSAGRLFDGMSALLGLRTEITYEGEAAILLEEAAARHTGDVPAWDTRIDTVDGRYVVDPRGWVRAAAALGAGEAAVAARAYHLALARALAQVCARVRSDLGLTKVVLSGGVFQNQILLSDVTQQLTALGFEAYSHRDLPTNDGGLSAGQLMVASAHLRRERADATPASARDASTTGHVVLGIGATGRGPRPGLPTPA